ncbi:MAG TPA: phosphoenolpyruvate--protein phosphotransferase [Ignavibacteria bacterium]|nr:phosphoenolpyruvate--protein phosphotransferase [Ignavibacteria bacterium]
MPTEITYKGIPASSGISIGKAFLYSRNKFDIDPHIIDQSEIAKEVEEFRRAINLSTKELEKIKTLSQEKIGASNSKMFDAQLDILNDKFFLNKIELRIQEDKRTPSFVFDDEISKIGKIFLDSNDEYLKERFTDITDVKNRVIRNLKKEKLVSKVEENSIIIAYELTPADTILFSKRKVQGYATDRGGITSHAAIISRALRVPAVVGMKDISKNISTGDFIIIDGLSGLIILNPTDITVSAYKKKLADLKEYENKLNKIIDLPSETADKKRIELSANIEFDEEIDFVVNTGHCGIGLYRTEHLFLEAGDFPSEERQIEEYTHIANVTYPNTVTIRTYDIGGDKLLPSSKKEDNPFLGWRGIRICLDRVDIFKEQLSALLISSKHKNVQIMIPMISSVNEVIKTKEILSEVKADLDKRGISYDNKIKMGIMIEVPSAYFIADELAKEVDFFSIGTNDLIQYILAVDRGNEYISNLFLAFHPAILRAIKKISDAAHRNKIKISVCGEMASDPLATAILVGLGIDELSVNPNVFPEIKQIIRKLNYEDVKKLCEEIVLLSTENEIRERVEDYYNEFVKIGM